jgi:hypothetical protein
MIVFAVRFGGGARGLRRGFVRFRRLVVGVFHIVSLVDRQISAGAKVHLIVSAESANGVLSEREKKTGTPPCRVPNKPHVEVADCNA